MIECPAGHRFGAATAPHVEAMDRISGFEGGLREAAGITGIARPFEAVNENQLRARACLGTLGVDKDLDAGFGFVEIGVDRETGEVESAGPVIAGDGEEVGVLEDGDERPQETILPCADGRTAYCVRRWGGMRDKAVKAVG